jgi:uncharacterized protein (TIGR02145 family)
MKKLFIYVSVFLIFSENIRGQAEQQSLPGVEEMRRKKTDFNLDEIKVRWKKAALENCTGVPCVSVVVPVITIPGSPTNVTAVAGNTEATVSFEVPSSTGGSAITGYTVTSTPVGGIKSGTGSPLTVTGLTNGTPYTFTVIATNAVGSSVASAASTAVTPAAPAPSFTCGTSTMTDKDNNTYSTVSIGAQCWTTTNLKVTRYDDGSLIGDSTNSTWGTAMIGARTENKESGSPPSTSVSGYVGTLGYLYNWYAVTDSRKLCPDGWHVPTDAEWTIMIQALDSSQVVDATIIGPQSGSAGTVMKSDVTNLIAGTGLGWNPGIPGTNTSGFSALPGGYRDIDGSFNNIRLSAYFWSATEILTNAWYRGLGNNLSTARRSSNNKSVGASVRCLRD